MNNHNQNNYAQSQAPMMAASGGPGGLGVDLSSAGLNINGATLGTVASNAGVGLQGADNGGAPDLDQLQQAYQRTGDRGSQHHPIAEFLYQLTKMLTDDNSEIIEWVDGRIKVHYPERLEGEVLHKYFRHSKFASFQRQLNYFGFRKIAGKGKMSPCSYVNEAATSDIRSLLLIKRKTNGSAARKAAMAQRNMQIPAGGSLDLRANLSALAAGAAAAAGGPNRLNMNMNMNMNSQAFNAAALFSQNANGAAAAAAGLGQFPLQQKSLGAAGNALFLNNENAMSLLMNQQQQQNKPPSAQDLLQDQNGLSKTPSAPSIEQLHAQLAASLANRQQNGLNPQLNPATMGLASSALNNVTSGGAATDAAGAPGGPASAALNATAALNNLQQQAGGAATAALNAAGGVGSNNLFDSAANLKSLVEDQQQRAAVAAANAASGSSGQLGNSAASQQLLNARLPSSGTLFPESLSTASFGNLLASSNRLSSLLSLNSFLSRDPSVADLVGVLPQGAQHMAAASQPGASSGMPPPRFQ